jgi:hypothetical protein
MKILCCIVPDCIYNRKKNICNPVVFMWNLPEIEEEDSAIQITATLSSTEI